MDTTLEFVDTFVADYIYAHLFSIECPNKADANLSTQSTEPWVWRPDTKYFHVPPPQAAYMSSLARDNPYRQFITLYFIGCFFAVIFYLSLATLSYHMVFDKRWMNHPKFLKNQIWLEIKITIQSMLIVAIFVAPVFVLEVRGYARLYDTTADGPGWWYNILQIPLLVLYIDFYSYWIHRFAHHPRVYSHYLFKHKVHHKFVITTPYGAQVTHPIEGLTHALTYHIIAFILPLHKVIHGATILFHVFWNVCIHDGAFLINNRMVVSAAYHSLHHTHYNCNFASIFSIFDRLHGTYREPEPWMFDERLMFKLQ